MPALRRGLLLAALLAGALALPRGALGHALLISADPASGSTVVTAPASVVLTFGEAPDPRLSRVKVLDTGGADHASGAVQAVPGQPTRLRVPVGPLPDGVYTVTWRTISSVDGHVVTGAFAFGVGA